MSVVQERYTTRTVYVVYLPPVEGNAPYTTNDMLCYIHHSYTVGSH